MKKIAIFFTIVFLLAGCSKGEDTIIGTTWVTNFAKSYEDEDLVAISFISDSSVKVFHTDSYLNETLPRTGTYSKNGNGITFNVDVVHNFSTYEIKSGTISGDVMVVTATHYSKTLDKTETYSFNFSRK